MPKKKILVDIDDTFCENVFVKKVNLFLKTNYIIDDFSDYLVDAIIPADKKIEFYNFFAKSDPYKNARIFDDAKQVLKRLNENYDVYISSSCIMPLNVTGSAKLFFYKYNFLLKNLPFLDPKKFIFTSSKDIVCCDIMIDDMPSHLKGEAKLKLLFSAYHNKNISDEELKNDNITRVNSWKEIENLLLKVNI